VACKKGETYNTHSKVDADSASEKNFRNAATAEHADKYYVRTTPPTA
jgi:hypothetical protein